MSGPVNTCWENGRFRLSIKFTRAYSESPPLLFFLTVPFHPNIDLMTGKPCTAMLEDKWRPDIKIAEILVYLQVF
jgi:ubiquitin-conjugating enzyme E2 U